MPFPLPAERGGVRGGVEFVAYLSPSPLSACGEGEYTESALS